MQLKFTHTFEDFSESLKYIRAPVARMKGFTLLSFMLLFFGFPIATIVLVMLYPPNFYHRQMGYWVMAHLVIPWLPWFGLTIFRIWHRSMLARGTESPIAPWKRPGLYAVMPKKWTATAISSAVSLFLVLFCAGAIWLALFTLWRRPLAADGLYVLGFGIAFMPMAMEGIAAKLVGLFTASDVLAGAWQQQSQLHDPVNFEADHEKLIFETPHTRTELKWTGIAGMIETTNLFVLFRSYTMFHMIPKRAFTSSVEADAFRNMVNTLAGAGTAGFPVLPADGSQSAAANVAAS